MKVLASSVKYDFYHRPEYQALAAQRDGGDAYLFLHSEEACEIALPCILRSIKNNPGTERADARWCDATSAYGYLGPVVSRADVPRRIVENFHSALRDQFQEMRVVSCFSRLHPLIPQMFLLEGLGECQLQGHTVSVDLTLPPDAQWEQYRHGHRSNIDRARSLGAICVEDANLVYLDAFIEIYNETMGRVNAEPFYSFDRRYFEVLLSAFGKDMHLFIASMNGEVMGGGLFVECDGIIQYHLGGIRDSFRRLAPTKLILDTVRRGAAERGLRIFHLGGGVGARDDSLLDFKAGFSDRRHEFSTWRWVVLPDVYQELCEQRSEWCARHGLTFEPSDYFPLYRAPLSPNQQQA